MADLLALADAEAAALWRDLRLGYTESLGHPLLRREIATLYETVDPDEVLVFSGRRGGDLRRRERAPRAGRPRDRRLARVPEPARGGPGRRRGRHAPRAAGGGRLGDRRRRAAAPGHAPDAADRRQRRRTTRRAALPDAATYRAVADIAADAGATLLSDEVYRFLELDAADRLPAGADVGPHGVSIGVMSKSFALAGLRIGWLASHDRALLDAAARFKDYTTICASAPAEILSLIALRARDRVLARSRAIVDANLALLDAFFARRGDAFAWVRPRGGSIAFPELARRRRRSTGSRRTCSRPRACCSRPARSSATPATTSGWASAGRTCPWRSGASRRSPSARCRRRTFADDPR